jgi:hypothetical protein
MLVPGGSEKDTKNQSRGGSGGQIKKPATGTNAQVASGQSSSKVLGKDLVQAKKIQALDTKLGPQKGKATIMKDLVTTTTGGGGGRQSKRKSKTQAKAA